MSFLEQGEFESKYHFQRRRECFGYDGFTPEEDEEFNRWWNNLSADAKWKSRVESWFVEWEYNFIHNHRPKELLDKIVSSFLTFCIDQPKGKQEMAVTSKELDEYENHIKSLIREVVLEMRDECE